MKKELECSPAGSKVDVGNQPRLMDFLHYQSKEPVASETKSIGKTICFDRESPCIPFPAGPPNETVPGDRIGIKSPQWYQTQESTSPTHQVQMSVPSLQRTKSYEIQVRKLNYMLSPPIQARHGPRLLKVKRFLKLCEQKCDPDGLDSRVTPATDSKEVINGKYILRDISFDAKAGELLGVAGPSGAGKSTLLEVLAGCTRPTSPSSSRCVLVNNQVMDVAHFRRVSGYVMQDDALFPTLTVLETLLFSARLRLPPTMSMAKKKSRVHALLVELGLQHVANTRIGNELIRGVSGGERRRVSIGVDVVHSPSVLILDEPTSGLDSAAAMNIVTMLRTMAVSRNCTVILSIHQPNFRILELMHSILLLADGKVVHHGSLDMLATRLEVAGHKIPAQVNVLEYAIEALNIWRVDNFCGKFFINVNDGPIGQKILLNCQQNFVNIIVDPQKASTCCAEVEGGDNEESCAVTEDAVSFANSSVQEIAVLAVRCFKNVSRTKELFMARSMQSLAAGLTLGTIFINSGYGSQGVQERLGFLAFSLTFFLTGSTEALPIFLQDRQILTRETSRGAYRISSYVLANALVFAPFLLVMGLLYTIPAYFLVKLNPSTDAFVFFALVMWLVLLEANSFVSFFAALVPNFIMGNSLIAICMGAFFLFSGYFISSDRIPHYWIFMHYLSLFKYPLDALLENEYEDRPGTCFAVKDPATGACTVTGPQALEQAGIKGRHHKWMDVGMMVTFFVFYRLLCYFVICFRISHRRP